MLDDSATHTRGAVAPPGFFCFAREVRAGARSCILVTLVIVAPRLAPADEPMATIPLETMVVTGEVANDAEKRAPTAFLTVIDAAERSRESETISDALAESVGVQVRRFGGLGSFATLSIRGSSSNQVEFFLDGVPLSRARNETVNLADLPFDILERIEVYRGTVPLQFGTGAIAGVVNLVTRPPSATPTTIAGGSYGSFETRKVVAAHSREAGGFELLGFVNYLGSKGDFAYEDDNGTPLNPNDDEQVTRKNNAFNAVDTLLKGARTLRSGLRLELTSETFYKDEGVPGIGSFQARNASQKTLRSLNYLRLLAPEVLADGLDGATTLFGTYERDQFQDLGRSGRPGGELGFLRQDRCDQTTLAGSTASFTYDRLPANRLAAVTELSYERFDGSNAAATVGPADEPGQTRLVAALGVQNELELFGDRLLFVPTARYQHLRDSSSASFDAGGRPSGPSENRNEDLWSVSGGTEIRAIDWLRLRANIGRYQRPPSFSELYGVRANVRGNPNLKPETSLNRDAGLVLSRALPPWLDDARLEYAYFDNDVDDLIVLVQTSPSFFTARNVGSARIRGHEVSSHATFRQLVDLSMNYTHQNAENLSSSPILHGKQLPGRPANELYTRLELRTPLGKPYYEFNFVSGNFTDQANLRKVPSRDIHTLGLTWQARDWLSVNFEARNVTDNQISDIGGFPLPGRSFFGTVQVDL